MTASKSSSLGQLYTNSKPNTVWNQIFLKHMTSDNFVGTKNALKTVVNTNQLWTIHTYLEGVLYYSEPCVLKVLWKSSSKNLESIVFQKGSPLTPFFKNAYSKIRPTGTFYRLKQKWKQVGKSSKSCNANVLRPISFNKIVSLITILFCGICLMLFIISFEIALKSRQGKLEDNGDHSNIT